MPLLDAYIPAGALEPDAEEKLLARLTDLLLEHEGADPTNPVARSIAWVFLHRPEAVFVAGERAVCRATASWPRCPRASSTTSADRRWWRP